MIGSLKFLDLAALRPSPTNPRKHFPADQLEELAESIREHGVLQPIVARPWPGEPGIFEVVAGERRYKASQLAQRATIPAIVSELSDGEVVEIQLVENRQRQDVRPTEEAVAIRRVLDSGRYGAGKAAIQSLAAKLGMSDRWVYDRLALLKLTEEARAELDAGAISAGHAAILVRYAPGAQTALLTDLLYERLWNGSDYVRGERTESQDVPGVRWLADIAKSRQSMDLDRAKFDPDNESLVAGAPCCSDCAYREGTSCLNRSCFQAKTEAHYAQLVQLRQAENPDAKLLIHRPEQAEATGAILRADCLVVKPDTPGAVPVIDVDGYGTRGEIVYVVQRGRDHDEGEGWAEKQAERRAKAAAERKFRRQVGDGVISLRPNHSVLRPCVPEIVVRVLAVQFWRSCSSDSQRQVEKKFGWKKLTSDAFELAAMKMTPEDLADVVLAMIAEADAARAADWQDEWPPATHLLAVAEVYGVDVELIRRECEASALATNPVRTSAPESASGKARKETHAVHIATHWDQALRRRGGRDT